MSASFDAIKEREQKLLCKTYSRYPVAVARGKGSRLWDFDGKEYVDLLTGIAVTALGHANEEVAELICDRARKFMHVSNLFYQEEQLDFAEKLLATCHLDKVFFCNSGAEANEAAIKLARRYQQKVKGKDAWEVITLDNCFHGRTLATLAATGKHIDGFGPLPEGFSRVTWGKLEALEAAITPHTAAVLMEVIQGEGGVIPVSMEYAKGVEALCRNHGLLLMIDEVQTGVARTGKFWGFQNFGITPDVITAAKALANGLPLGAMLVTEEAAQGFDYGSHGSTFGGGAFITSVGAKVVEIIQRDKLAERAKTLGDALQADVRALAARKPGMIKEVRGMGLLVGIDLALSPERAKKVWDTLIERGFILNLAQGTVLRLVPPLNIDEADLQAFVRTLEEVLEV